MRLKIAFAIGAISLICSGLTGAALAQTAARALLAERDRLFAERAVSRAELDAVQSEAQKVIADQNAYDADLAVSTRYCNATVDESELGARLADCKSQQAALALRVPPLATRRRDVAARLTTLRDRIRQETERLAAIDVELAGMEPSSEYQGELARARALQQSQLRRLLLDVPGVVPAPPRTTFQEGIITGISVGPSAAADLQLHAKSPYSGRDYASEVSQGRAAIFSFGQDDRPVSELVRGLLDSLSSGQYTLSSDAAKALVHDLQGDHFMRLTAHSNGATIAEALVRQGVITVDELNIVGGDRSLANVSELQDLLDSGKVKRVRVWINPGDPVPSISSGVSGRLQDEALYWAGRAAGAGADRAKVEVCITDGAVGQAPGLESHYLASAYFPNMAALACR